MSRILLAVGLMLVVAPSARAQDDAAVKRAKAFWEALAKGDAAGLKEFYAPKVTLKAGSELLKKEWGLNESGDRSKDLLLERDKLIGGYSAMITKIGKDRWAGIFGTVDWKKQATLSVAKDADKPFGGIQKGDLVMKVTPGKSDDAFYYVLRKDAKGQWQVVAEAADY